VKRSIIWGGKGKDRAMLTKSLINVRDEKALEGRAIKDLKGISLKDQKVKADDDQTSVAKRSFKHLSVK